MRYNCAACEPPPFLLYYRQTCTLNPCPGVVRVLL